MRILRSLVFFLATSFPLFTGAQTPSGCPETFFNVLGSPGLDERGYSVVDAGDGNLYVTGTKGDSALILKTNRLGDILWARTFDFTPVVIDHIAEIIVDSDGMIVGCGTIGENLFTDGFAFRYDPVADQMLWYEQILDISFVYGMLEKGPGGNFLLYANWHESTQDDALLLEIERSSGGLMPSLQKRYHLGSSDAFRSMVYHDGALYASGRYTAFSGFFAMRIAVSRLTLSGSEAWSLLSSMPQSGGIARLYGNDMVIDDNAVLTVGSGDDNGTSITQTEIFLQKTSLDGQLLWVKKFDLASFNNEFAEEIVSVPDGYVIYGHNRTVPGDLFLLKTDKDGNLQWAKKLDYSPDDRFTPSATHQSQLLYLDGYLYGTAIVTANDGTTDMLYFKTDLNGDAGANCGYIQPTDATETSLAATPLNVNLTIVNDPQGFADLDRQVQPSTIDNIRLCSPVVFQEENLLFCEGSTITVNGVVYDQSATVTDTLSGAGCDTVVTYHITQVPQPTRTETIEFCPGDGITLNGTVYTQPATVNVVLPGIPCDTLLTYQIQFTDTNTPANLSLTCPADITVSTGAGPVNYNQPLFGSDCICPGIELEMIAGLPSGSVFPAGTTPVCFTARDSCGTSSDCCFTVSVQTDPGDEPCEVKVNGCLRFEILGIFADPEGNKTYRMQLINNCAQELVHLVFQVPDGLDAESPDNNTVYTAPSGRNYLVRNPNFSPFYGVRFSSQGVGIANGDADVFEYTLPPQANPLYINAMARLSPATYTQVHLNVYNCPVQPISDRPGLDRSAGPGPARGRIYPNPSAGTVHLELNNPSTNADRIRVLDAQGRVVLTQPVETGQSLLTIRLPEQLQNGLYLLQYQPQTGPALQQPVLLIR